MKTADLVDAYNDEVTFCDPTAFATSGAADSAPGVGAQCDRSGLLSRPQKTCARATQVSVRPRARGKKIPALRMFFGIAGCDSGFWPPPSPRPPESLSERREKRRGQYWPNRFWWSHARGATVPRRQYWRLGSGSPPPTRRLTSRPPEAHAAQTEADRPGALTPDRP